MPYVVGGRVEVHVVDSDKQNRRSFIEVFKSAGLEVREYTSGRDFFDRYEYSEAGCALIEMRMPHISGLDVLRWLQQHQQNFPAMMTVSHTDVSAAMEALRCGAEDVLIRPIAEHVLLDRINHLLMTVQERRRICARRKEALGRLKKLSIRERQIVALILTGLGTKQIAQRLHLSHKTIENRRSGIYLKLEIEGLAELVAMAVPLLGCCCKHHSADKTTSCGLRPDDRLPCRLNNATTLQYPCPLCSKPSLCARDYQIPAWPQPSSRCY